MKRILIFISMVFSCSIFGQEAQLDINNIVVNEEDKTLTIYLNGLVDGRPFIPIDRSRIKITDTKLYGNGLVDSLRIAPSSMKNFGDEGLTMLFLLDKSGSMREDKLGDKFGEAKTAIKNAVRKYNLPKASTFLATFHDSIGVNLNINIDNVEEVLDEIEVEPKGKGRDTDLYYALDYKIQELQKYSGRKVIMLFTDGKNDVIGDDKKINFRYNDIENPDDYIDTLSRVEITNTISNLAPDFSISCIGFGHDVDSMFLKEVIERTPNDEDEYLFAESPADINAAIDSSTSKQAYNFRLKAIPNELCEYTGDKRKLKVFVDYQDEWVAGQREYAHGFYGGGVNLCSGIDESDNLALSIVGIVGLGIVLILLLVLINLIPLFKKIQFNKKYVKKYRVAINEERAKKGKSIKGSGIVKEIVKKDLLTGLSFKDDDMVVTKCKHWTALSSWKANKNRCIQHPKCREGIADYDVGGSFFNQNGINRQLNWLWFGALGGFIAWIIFALIKSQTAMQVGDYFFKNALEDGVSSYWQHYWQPFYASTITGLALGFGITLTLSYVEEKGQSRAISWGRILLRTLMGFLLGGVIFFGINLLFMELFQQLGLIGDFICWLLFGTVVALVISLKSSIEWQSALKGGLAASALGFIFYAILFHLIDDKQIAKIVGLIVYGLVLGIFLNVIISMLEDFALEYVEPARFARVNPISKWLKGDVPAIYIGTDAGCYVYVKWEDKHVAPKHAALTYEKGKVFLEPMAPTLINDRVVDKKVELKHEDELRFGASSITKMKFIANKVTEEIPKKEVPKMKSSKSKVTIGSVRRKEVGISPPTLSVESKGKITIGSIRKKPK